MYDLPTYVWLMVGLGALGIPAALGGALYQGARASGAATATAALTGGAGFGALITWIAVTALLAGRGLYAQPPVALLPRGLLTALAVLLALLAASQIPPVRRSLTDERTPARLALVHTFRVLGIAFVLVMLLGRLPALFALPAGLGDFAIGVSAPFVASRLLRRGVAGLAVWRFNLLGILDLVVAATAAVLALRLGVSPSTAPLTLLPLAVVPTALVPSAVALHLISLWNVRRWRVSARPHSPIPATVTSRG